MLWRYGVACRGLDFRFSCGPGYGFSRGASGPWSSLGGNFLARLRAVVLVGIQGLRWSKDNWICYDDNYDDAKMKRKVEFEADHLRDKAKKDLLGLLEGVSVTTVTG